MCQFSRIRSFQVHPKWKANRLPGRVRVTSRIALDQNAIRISVLLRWKHPVHKLVQIDPETRETLLKSGDSQLRYDIYIIQETYSFQWLLRFCTTVENQCSLAVRIYHGCNANPNENLDFRHVVNLICVDKLQTQLGLIWVSSASEVSSRRDSK